MEGFNPNQEASKAEKVDTELRSQSQELSRQVESLPASVQRSLPGFKRIIATSILSLAAIGCEKQVNSAEKEPDNKNRIVLKAEEAPTDEKIPFPEWLMLYLTLEKHNGGYVVVHKGETYKLTAEDLVELKNISNKPTEKVGQEMYDANRKDIVDYVETKLEKIDKKAAPSKRVEEVKQSVPAPDPTKWLELPVQEVGGDYFINIGDGIYKLSASGMSELYKFKKGHDDANVVRRQINKKFDDEKLEKLKGAKPVERKSIWADGVDQQTKDSLAENDKKAYAQNLEKYEKDISELENKKKQDENYIGTMTKLAIEKEIKRLGEKQ